MKNANASIFNSERLEDGTLLITVAKKINLLLLFLPTNQARAVIDR